MPPPIPREQHPLTSALSSALTSQNLAPHPSWLQQFLSTQSPTPSLAALTKTATFRILAGDITETLAPTTTVLPQNLSSPRVRESRLEKGVVVQVLDVLDVSTSLQSQIEDLESFSRGEGRGQGRGSVVRLVDEGEGQQDDGGGGGGGAVHGGGGGVPGGAGAGKKVWKFLLQDCAGSVAWALDSDAFLSVGIHPAGQQAGSTGQQGVSIGSKILLKPGTVVARGVILLERERVVILGGRIESMDKAWREERVGRLKALMGERREGD